ncbi:MAG: hypothetical protein ACRERV_05200, partial [Methylococcales bacterium]
DHVAADITGSTGHQDCVFLLHLFGMIAGMLVLSGCHGRNYKGWTFLFGILIMFSHKNMIYWA